MTMHTTSCFGDKSWSCPIRLKILNSLLNNAQLAAHAHIAHHTTSFVVVTFFCILCNQFAICKFTTPLFPDN